MNTPLRFGVIGTGPFGKNYVRLLKDTDGVKLKSAVGRAAVDNVLYDSEIDCVVIATPVSTHFSLAKSALDAGKHVLMEKPMVRTMDEAYKLREIVRKKKTTFMVGHQYLYHDYVRFLRSSILEGGFGFIRYVFAEHFYHGTIRHDVGCFWETATHELALIDYLFKPDVVRDVSANLVSFSGTKRDDFASVTIRFGNGLLATIVVSWFAPEKIRRITFGGEQGSAVFDDCAKEDKKLTFFLYPYPKESVNTKKSWRMTESEEKYILTPYVAAREPLQNELNHFIECVRMDKTPLTDIEHGFRITSMLDSVERALQR